LEKIDYLVCLDSEWTCWEDSLEKGWPDPDFPPEVIQIGLSIFDNETLTLLDEFVSYVSPRVNPMLSEYCKNLLSLTQDTIDNAKSFSSIANDIAVFLEAYPPSRAVVYSFGPDWETISADALRHSVDDPLDRFEKLDLRVEAARILGHNGQSILREWVYRSLGLSDCAKRHDALYDARDLVRIIDALRTY
jgi:inhibitor of KinA sporulation pathway (predicted exonuclease)